MAGSYVYMAVHQKDVPVTIKYVPPKDPVLGLRCRKGSNSMGRISIAGVLRLRATSAVSRDKSVRRSPQDDDFVGILTKNILNKLALMGLRPGLSSASSESRRDGPELVERGRLNFMMAGSHADTEARPTFPTPADYFFRCL